MLLLAMETQAPQLKYCLYARKSSESDERQAMSIDSQLAEMRALAVNEGLNVVCELQESHSAKDSGKRPVYNQMLAGIASDEYNAVLTWAPDRLSRNAGDLGSVVDLMDQHKLLHIRTYSQTFTNSPNEKFLLMILCLAGKARKRRQEYQCEARHPNEMRNGLATRHCSTRLYKQVVWWHN